eukprot:tig00021721_g23226.t1
MQARGPPWGGRAWFRGPIILRISVILEILQLLSNPDFDAGHTLNSDVDSELESELNSCLWPAALSEAHALRAVCKRFKEAIDAAGGPLALFEEAEWDGSVEHWLVGLEGGVDAFLAEHAPRFTGLRKLMVYVEGNCKHGARFLAAVPCWPSLLSLRLFLPPGATCELRACLDALAAVPAGKLSLDLLEVDVDEVRARAVPADEFSEETSALLWAIARRCAPSLRALRLYGIAVEGRWEDLLPSAGLHDLYLEGSPRPVALGGLEQSGAAATLETLSVYGGGPVAEQGGPDSSSARALAIAALPALSILKIGLLSRFALSHPNYISGPALSTRPSVEWWAAVLAGPAGARLEGLSLRRVGSAGRILAALGASGPPLALRALSLAHCSSGSGDASRFEGLLSACNCPALRELDISSCDELLKRKEAASLVILLARLTALEKLAMCDCVQREACRSATELPLPPDSFPSLRVLELGGPSTVRLDCWAALLASPAAAALQSLSLSGARCIPVNAHPSLKYLDWACTWSMLGALGASGPSPALRCLSLDMCRFEAEEAPGLAGLLASLPALEHLRVHGCPELEEFLAGRGDAEAAGPRLLRELKARGARVVWHRPPAPSPDNADIDSDNEDDVDSEDSGYTSSEGGGAE